MKAIRYVTGDATKPPGDEPRIIAHVCNNVGAWGAGFVLAISRRWTKPEREYRAWAARQQLPLGETQFVVDLPGGIVVANMVAQDNIGPSDRIPLRYGSLLRCLSQVAAEAIRRKATVHTPRIGCGLAGGSWDLVGPLVEETMSFRDIEVTVYDLPSRNG